MKAIIKQDMETYGHRDMRTWGHMAVKRNCNFDKNLKFDQLWTALLGSKRCHRLKNG